MWDKKTCLLNEKYLSTAISRLNKLQPLSPFKNVTLQNTDGFIWLSLTRSTSNFPTSWTILEIFNAMKISNHGCTDKIVESLTDAEIKMVIKLTRVSIRYEVKEIIFQC